MTGVYVWGLPWISGKAWFAVRLAILREVGFSDLARLRAITAMPTIAY
jgi:hypothetical protein